MFQMAFIVNTRRKLLLYVLLLLFCCSLIEISLCDSLVPFMDDQPKLPTITTTTPVDVSNEYNLNICGDTLQRPEANLELRTSNNFETLQLYQYGKIWPLSNRSFPFNVACTLHLSACSACIIQLSWNSGLNKITFDPSRSSPLKQTCEKPWDFKYKYNYFFKVFLFSQRIA